MATIRNPVEWASDHVRGTSRHLREVGRNVRGAGTAGTPTVHEIALADLKQVLWKGVDDFGACRTDVIFLCLIYPVIGIVLVWSAFDYGALPLLFPLAAGFALLGPVAAVGLYEMSRRREQGLRVTWQDWFATLASPAFGAVFLLGLVLLAIFLLWLAAAQGIYWLTLGPGPPASLGAFVQDVFTTGAGWAMIVVGLGVGLLFAVLVLTISVVSFPLLLDRNAGLATAVTTSVRAVRRNPRVMAAWGLIVLIGLAVGSIPVFVGLIVILPVLGHATWHLYRRVVSWDEAAIGSA